MSNTAGPLGAAAGPITPNSEEMNQLERLKQYTTVVADNSRGDGAVKLRKVQRAGGKAMDAEALLKGFAVPAGTQLS